MKHLELFAGIGGFRRALDLLSKDKIMKFESIGYSEIDTKADSTYRSNYSINNKEIVVGDIVEFTKNISNINNLPDFKLLTAGFPCQTFSMMGKQEGFNEDRGQMFFRIIDILKIKRPTYVLLENVKNLYTHNKGNTFACIKKYLEELGYNVCTDIFNSLDFCLPQKRNRVIIFATTNPISNDVIHEFTADNVKESFKQIYDKSSLMIFNTVLDVLAKTVDNKYFLSDKIKPTILSNGSAGFVSKSEIDQIIARPLTATMHKMHRACQDNYYSQIFIESKGKISPSEMLSKDELANISIRKLTPEEAFALQGFPNEFVQNAQNSKVADGALYKQAGNAVSVNVIYAVMYYLISKGIIKE